MYCTNCGTKNENTSFCTSCGCSLNPTPNYNQPSNNQENIPSKYKPIGAWGYFGYELLFSIPVVGFIALIVLALSSENVNLRNFARSKFCYLIIVIIIIAIAASFGLLTYHVTVNR